ncbi:hypothetical protein Rmf_39670 [Roseomonas fluvialis]|uniref:Uncharacterized protein n=1 Tax=Roseomonas fluvialis TaxID=1750527 RepID=A0ABN6P5V3_9PROT|nr:hypothetical protein Rmf_39670 [Roseomonas fluvialis]
MRSSPLTPSFCHDSIAIIRGVSKAIYTVLPIVGRSWGRRVIGDDAGTVPAEVYPVSTVKRITTKRIKEAREATRERSG